MSSNQLARGIIKGVIALCLIALGLYVLYLISPLIGYILIASVIALIGKPITDWLGRKLKLSSILSVVITMLIMVIISVGLISSFIPLLIDQSRNLSLLDMQSLQLKLEQTARELCIHFNIDFDTVDMFNFKKYLSFIDIPNFFNSLISFIGSFGIGFFSVLFISFFFLKDGRKITEGILNIVPDKNAQEGIRNSLEKIKNLLSRYFVGLIIQIGVLFVIYTITLLLIGVQNALLIAVLCALLNLIPYLGPLISYFIMIGLTMTGLIGEEFSAIILPKMIYVTIGFAIAQLLDNFVNQPLIFSNSVKSHPLEIFFVILCGGYLYGVVGMIIAIPTYTVIKVILKEFMSDNSLVKSLTKGM